MDIISRNFFRLLRAGVFLRQEQVEPMSQWKWRQVWLLALAHGVENEAWEGVKRLREQFFMRLTEKLSEDWEHSVHGFANSSEESVSRVELPENAFSVLSHSQQKCLSKITGETNVRSATFRLLYFSLQTANAMLNGRQWVKGLVAMGRIIVAEGQYVDEEQLEEWADSLHSKRMLQIEGTLLVSLLGIEADAVPFYTPSKDTKKDGRLVEDVVNAIWAKRPSLAFIKYFPQESLVTYTASIIQNIKNVEE